MNTERKDDDPDALLRRGLKAHHFGDIRDALDDGASLRIVIDACGVDWVAQHIVLSDVHHRLNLLLYPQLYQDEAGDLYDMLMERNRHFRATRQLNNRILFYAFELDTWEVNADSRFVFGTTISFYLLARKTIENGAAYDNQIAASALFKSKYMSRICTWYIQGRKFDNIGVDAIAYFEKFGLVCRDAYDVVLKEAITMGDMGLLVDMIDKSANIGSFIESLEQDICNIHILNWPDHDLLSMFADKGILPPTRQNRLKNRLTYHANQLLKKSLTEQWNFEGSKDYELTIKAIEAGATFDAIIEDDDDESVITRILFMTFSAYYPDDFTRPRRILDFFGANGVCMEHLSVQLVTRLYEREVPYYEHMKLSIINSCVLESLFGTVSDDVDHMIWHIIFMMIMKEKIMEIKLTRRWMFSRRNMIQTARNYRQVARLNNEDVDNSSDSSDSDTESDAYTLSSSEDEDEASILEYFNVFGLKIEAGFAFYMKRILQCARHLALHSNLTTIKHSKGIVCRRCHETYLKKYNPTDC